jgi:hypothetical protein
VNANHGQPDKVNQARSAGLIRSRHQERRLRRRWPSASGGLWPWGPRPPHARPRSAGRLGSGVSFVTQPVWRAGPSFVAPGCRAAGVALHKRAAGASAAPTAADLPGAGENSHALCPGPRVELFPCQS